MSQFARSYLSIAEEALPAILIGQVTILIRLQEFNVTFNCRVFISFRQFIFMSPQITTLRFWFNNLCKIISKLLKKLVKLPVGDL